MASVLLFPHRGTVFRYDDANLPLAIAVDGFDGPSLNAALTAVGAGGEANVQFRHTLKGLILVYVFGERIGDVRLSGVTFPKNCQAGPAQDSGFENIQDYYDTHGLAAAGSPLAIAVGRRVYNGLLTRFRVDTQDPDSGLGSFSLDFKYLPRE